MTLRSAIYIGKVRHRRKHPAHEFSFPLFMMFIDLSELDTVLSLSRLWGRSRFCPARFRRSDYLIRGDLDLDASIRSCVEQRLGRRPEGPIRMLTHFRYFGTIFNPVTFYYCFDRDERLSAIVAEITNTPWRERHAYVLDAATAERRGPAFRWRFGKDFHVSPFMPMDLDYDWSFDVPADRLLAHMNLLARDGVHTFDATLTLSRREITPARLRWLLVQYPFMTARVIFRIHFEALRLWLKRARIHPHPRGEHPPAATETRP